MVRPAASSWKLIEFLREVVSLISAKSRVTLVEIRNMTSTPGYAMTNINGYIISLSPTRLSAVLARRGRVIQAESIALLPEQWNECWDEGLIALDQPLRQLRMRFRSGGRSGATLLYQSPTLTKQIYPFNQVVTNARDATRAKIRETVGLSDPVIVHALGGDRAESGACMMLAYSDRDETLRSLYAWLKRNGFNPGAMIPMSVATTICASEDAMKCDDRTAVLYLGADCSVIALSTQGKLVLVRPSNLGYQKLIDSYQRAFDEHLNNQEQTDESYGAAVDGALDPVRCLFEYGVPFQPVEYHGIDLRSTVLPCMAPVLQRLSVDIKQSMRFGLGDTKDIRNLYLYGSGAAIPGIPRAIGEHIDMHVQPAPEAEMFAPERTAGAGSVERYLVEHGVPSRGLLPRVAEEDLAQRTLTRSLVAGVALAGFVMAGQYIYASRMIDHGERLLLEQAPMVERVAGFSERRTQAQESALLLSEVAELILDQHESTPQWVGALATLTKARSLGVRILEIRAEEQGGQRSINLSGYAVAGKEKSPDNNLDELVRFLNQSTLIDSVKLGATERIDLSANQASDAERWGLQFELQVFVRSDPSPYTNLVQAGTQPEEWIEP